MPKPPLDARACRDICWDMVSEEGPLTVSQLARRLRAVFRVDTAFLAITLCTRKGGFVVDSGVVYSKPNPNWRKKR